MYKRIFCSGLMCLALLSPSLADHRPQITRLQEMRLSEGQVQEIMSIFFSRAPSFLSEDVDAERLVSELAPQAYRVLNRQQRRLLRDLAPEQQVRRFGSMSQDERTRFIFDSARSLVHPSKQEWLRRMEEMVE